MVNKHKAVRYHHARVHSGGHLNESRSSPCGHQLV